MDDAKTRWRTGGICAALVLVTLACYWPVREYGFIDMDDAVYVSENPPVMQGLTRGGVGWAFTTFHQSNWHPLTWLSHMLDCQLFGLHAGAHHMVNVLLHTANSLLVFWLLYRLTGALWRSALMGALFAWHPLHVESVVWIAERKDVLSTLFGLLTLLAYNRYAQNRSWQVYALTLALFALGLMAKPMLVTLPFVMLLLDYWPLQRWQAKEGRLRLLVEKAPFLALSTASSVVTCLAQQSVTVTLRDSPLSARLANGALACGSYLWKTFWPSHLAVMYSYHVHQPVAWIIVAGLLLVVASLLCTWGAKRFPYLFTGWFWFLGTLVPVIGLVQVGTQAMADRYMYIPSIGLFTLLVWGARDLCRPLPSRNRWLVAAGTLALVGSVAVTRSQIYYWRSSETLYRHSIAVTRENYAMYYILGNTLLRAGREDEAIDCYAQAVRLKPGFLPAQYNLSTLLLKRDRPEEAIAHFKSALRLDPKNKDALASTGITLTKLGRPEEAVVYLRRTIAVDPCDPVGYFNLGVAMMQWKKLKDAMMCFDEALRLKPDYQAVHNDLGVVLMQLGQPQEGIVHLREAVRLAPDNPRAHLNLGFALNELHQPEEALQEMQQARQLALAAGQNDLATQIENMLQDAQPAP